MFSHVFKHDVKSTIIFKKIFYVFAIFIMMFLCCLLSTNIVQLKITNIRNLVNI